MPSVQKQTNNKPGKTRFAFSPIVGSKIGMRVSIYGRGKTGKTRLASTFPKPLAIIETEDGTKSLGTVKGGSGGMVYNVDMMGEAIQAVREGSFKTVVLDNASELQDLALKSILGIEELPTQKSWGMASREQWGQCAVQTKELLRELLKLSEAAESGGKAMNVVVIAHERNFKDDGDSGDLLAPVVGSALSPSVCGWLNGACDYICQTYIRQKTQQKTVKIGNVEKVVTQRVGGIEFCLRIGPDPVYMTGFRLPPGVTLPDSLIDPSYESIIQVINGVNRVSA